MPSYLENKKIFNKFITSLEPWMAEQGFIRTNERTFSKNNNAAIGEIYFQKNIKIGGSFRILILIRLKIMPKSLANCSTTIHDYEIYLHIPKDHSFSQKEWWYYANEDNHPQLREEILAFIQEFVIPTIDININNEQLKNKLLNRFFHVHEKEKLRGNEFFIRKLVILLQYLNTKHRIQQMIINLMIKNLENLPHTDPEQNVERKLRYNDGVIQAWKTLVLLKKRQKKNADLLVINLPPKPILKIIPLEEFSDYKSHFSTFTQLMGKFLKNQGFIKKGRLEDTKNFFKTYGSDKIILITISKHLLNSKIKVDIAITNRMVNEVGQFIEANWYCSTVVDNNGVGTHWCHPVTNITELIPKNHPYWWEKNEFRRPPHYWRCYNESDIKPLFNEISTIIKDLAIPIVEQCLFNNNSKKMWLSTVHNRKIRENECLQIAKENIIQKMWEISKQNKN